MFRDAAQLCLSLSLFASSASLLCQQRSDAVVALSPTLARTSGREPTSRIAYTRLYLTAQSADAPLVFDLSRPTLTVQCTQRPNGKLLFELFLNNGGVTDTTFYPPWKPSGIDLYPPRTDKLKITLQFLGYTHVKPVTRQFELVPDPGGQMRYNSPSSGSPNMEEIAFYFQYLRALPTLRVTWKDHAAVFSTEPLLAQIREEPLCRASGLQ